MLQRLDLIARGDNPGAYFALVYRSLADGSLLPVEIPYERYKAMGEKGGSALNPAPKDAPPGYEWTGESISGHRFDTPSGLMEGDSFCDDGKDVMIQLDGKYSCTPKAIIEKMVAVHEGDADAAVASKEDKYAVTVAVPKDGSEGFRITKTPTAQELGGEIKVSKDVIGALAEALSEEKT